MTRLRLLQENWTSSQHAAADAIQNGPRGQVRGPFLVLLHRPEIAEKVQDLGRLLRFEGELDQKLREIAVLVTAHAWGAEYEWQAHEKIALEVGVEPEAIEAIASDAPPVGDAAQQAVIVFCRELHRTHGVSDAAYATAQTALGESGIVELVAICGYYAMIAMVLNVARVPATGLTPT